MNRLPEVHRTSRWTGPRAFEPRPVDGPSPWLLQNADLLRADARVLDVAAGRGRHALLLAAAGLHVTAVDRDGAALAELAETAANVGATVVTEIDIESDDDVDLGDARFNVVLVFNGGVTLAWLIERIQEWDAMLAERRRAARRRPKTAAPVLTETVH